MRKSTLPHVQRQLVLLPSITYFEGGLLNPDLLPVVIIPDKWLSYRQPSTATDWVDLCKSIHFLGICDWGVNTYVDIFFKFRISVRKPIEGVKPGGRFDRW